MDPFWAIVLTGLIVAAGWWLLILAGVSLMSGDLVEGIKGASVITGVMGWRGPGYLGHRHARLNNLAGGVVMDPYLSFEEQAAARWRDAINYAAHIVPLTDEEENES